MKTFIKYLLITGIVILSVPLDAITQTGHWVNMNPSISPPARSGHGMAYLKNDLVLIFGGDADDGRFLDDTWIYDLSKNTWNEIKSELRPAKLDLPALVHIDDGKVLLFGGTTKYYDSDETWLFDYETLSWTKLNPSRKPTPRERTSSAFLGGKKIIVFSGFPPPLMHDDYCNDTWIFDLNTNQWDSVESISPIGREVGQMCELNNQNVFLYGGWNPGSPNQASNFNDNWIFNKNSEKWYNITPKHWNCGRSSSSMAQLKTNLVLVFGGDARDSNNIDPDYQWSDDSWLFDGKENDWTQLHLDIKPQGRYFHKVAKISDGKVLLFGGVSKKDILNDTWLFEFGGTEVNENQSTSDIISPNPATDFIEISVGVRHAEPLQSEVRIYNVFGQVQTTPSLRDTPPWKGGEKVRIDVSGLLPGMYFVRVGVQSYKFIKLK